MPLIWDLSAEIRAWLTPNKLRYLAKLTELFEAFKKNIGRTSQRWSVRGVDFPGNNGIRLTPDTSIAQCRPSST